MAYDPYLEDELASPYGSAVAFDEPDASGLRYPIATPRGGTFDFSAVPSHLIRTPEQSQAAYDSQAQYQAELARADRNRAEDAAQQDPATIQQAIRLQGLMKYRNLIANGAAPAEAIRQAAPELYFNHPQATALATRPATSITPPSIRQIPINGGTALFVDDKYRTTLRTPQPKAPPVQKDVAPPDVKALQFNNKALIKQAEADLERQTKALEKAETPDEKSAIGRAALAARANLEKLMQENVVLSTNYPRPSIQAPPSVVQQALTPPTTVDEFVLVVSPDGVAGKVPRSKLDAAKKQGYKER